MSDPSETTPGPDDLDDLNCLVTEAGWNQVDADWQMMMREGQTFGFRDNGRVVASALALPYGPDFGWISMVLVAMSHRRRGLATLLMQRCMVFLEDAGLTQVLDATSDGLKVYEKLGFSAGLKFQRWKRSAIGYDTPDFFAPVDLTKAVFARDLRVSGVNRQGILTDLERRGTPSVVQTDGTHFALSRNGNHAVQIGPIVAQDITSAVAAFEQLDTAIGLPAVIDIPDVQTEFAEIARARGYTPVRAFTRMMRGSSKYPISMDTYAFAGPELG